MTNASKTVNYIRVNSVSERLVTGSSKQNSGFSLYNS
jgi:hypothetical protein